MKKKVFVSLLLSTLLLAVCMGCGKESDIKPFEEKHPKEDISIEVKKEPVENFDMVEDFFEVGQYEKKFKQK